jgi:nucleoside 2-deoxyribosyltransferase
MPTKQKIPVVYVAGPYRAATRELIAENIAVARSVAVSSARMGWFPLCPHTNTAHFDDDLPGQDQFFLDGTLALMERCDAVVLINGWRYSAGTLGEVHRARELGIPIFACLEDLPAADEFAGRAVQNCAECQGDGHYWLAGASAHPNNRFICASCKGTGKLGMTVVDAHDLVTREAV